MLAILGATTALGACSAPYDDDPVAAQPSVTATTPAPGSAPRTPATNPSRAKRPLVILISIDALNPTAITQLAAQGRVPTLRLLMDEGASTLNARTAYEQTNTLPNHTGILTGRTITGPDGTHVTFNTEHAGTLEDLNGHYIPGVFDRVHDAGLSTVFLAEKTKFEFLVRSWDAVGGARDDTGKDDGRSKLDLVEIDTNPGRLTSKLLTRLRTAPPSLTFLHIAGPDEAGHGDKVHGFMGPRYLGAVAAADVQLATILDEVRTNPALTGRTTIVLTADHGGRGLDVPPGYGHRGPTVLDNYRIPFLVWGPEVPAGADLYAVNKEGRTDPGTRRVDYTGPQPIRNLDAADLVLSILGLPPLPDSDPEAVATLRRR